jgi:hypothetical protein
MTLSIAAENVIQHIPLNVLKLAADMLGDRSLPIRNTLGNMIGYYIRRND